MPSYRVSARHALGPESLQSKHKPIQLLSESRPPLYALLAPQIALSASAEALKIYILAVQPNMEGRAQTKTFPAVAKDPKTEG